MKKILLLLVLVGFFSCNTAENTSAVSFLWNEEPEPSSTKIMVISDLEGENFRNEVVGTLEALGFVIEDSDENRIVTEPMEAPDNLMMLSLELSNNTVIISGSQGTGEDVDDWQTVKKGTTDPASFEWELMEVLANSIEHTSIRYN